MAAAGDAAADWGWGCAAEAWARAAEKPEVGASAEAARWMLDAAGLSAGDRVLELACGAGRVGLAAAHAVGPDGDVVCSDFADEMVRVAGERAAKLGLENVQTRVLDAQALELEDESFDVVLCRFGYMLMSDPEKAFAESARVLRPGGRLALAVWGEAERNPRIMSIFAAVMEQLGAPPPPPGTPGPFALSDRPRLEGLIAGAGLEDVEIASLDAQHEDDSAESWWRDMLEIAGPLQAILENVAPADGEAIRERAFANAAAYARSDGLLSFPAAAIGARARKPGGPASRRSRRSRRAD